MKIPKNGIRWAIAVEPEVATEYAGTKLKDYFTDPDVMVETELRSKKLFYDLYDYGFPEVKSLSLSCLFYTCASVLGARIIFPEDDSPQIEGRVINELNDIKKLQIVKDIESAGYIPDLIQKYEYLKKKSAITGITPIFSLSSQSPLGTAIVLRGTEIFVDIVTNPEVIKDLLEVITETAIKILKFQEKFTGEKKESVGMDDDYGGLVSPVIYEEFNFPYMKRIYDEFGKKDRSIHSETLGKGHLRFLRQLGITNYDAWPYHNLTVKDIVKELPDISFTWNCVTTKDLFSHTPEQIKDKFQQAAADGATGMNLNLCARGVPRENIKAFIEIAREFS